MIKQLKGKNVGGLIEATLPQRKTSMFFALLILGLAQANLMAGWIENHQWMTVAMFVLAAYVIKRYKQSQLENGEGTDPKQ
jgi:hypothetical protein